MKKPILAIMALILVAVTLIPVYADITNHTWLGAMVDDEYDTYYNDYIVGYKEGASAVLAVWVRNNNVSYVNVTRVYVSFDWGAEYDSTQMSVANPAKVLVGQTRVFYVNFTIPSVAVASNMYLHAYNIYAVYSVKNATGNNNLPGTWRSGPYDNFAVFSADQATALDLTRIIDDYPAPSYWESTRARILANRAENETDAGWRYYEAGDFTRARQRFATALDYLNQAWDAEETFLTVWEELEIEEMRARIRSLDAMSSFLNGLSTMWVLFGIGWVLLGIGYIIKYLRAKRQEAAT